MFIDIRRNNNISNLVFLHVCNAPDFRDAVRLEQWLYNVGMYLHNKDFWKNGEIFAWVPKALVDARAPLKNHADTEFDPDKYCIILDATPQLVDYGKKAHTHYLCAMHQVCWNTTKQNADSKVNANAHEYTLIDNIVILVSTVFMLPIVLLVLWSLRFLVTGSL